MYNHVSRETKLLKGVAQGKAIYSAGIEAGYSEKTMSKAPTRTLKAAINKVNRRALDGDAQSKTILDVVGISREQVIERYQEIALKSNQHHVSLTALTPLLSHIGLDLDGNNDGKQTNIQLNIVENKTPHTYDIDTPTV